MTADDYVPKDNTLALQSQLPLVQEDQVPLDFIFQRLASKVYDELQSMMEILPSTDPTARKSMILDWALKSRRGIMRLFVVLRWAFSSAGSETMALCKGIQGFLNEQMSTLEGVRDEFHALVQFIPTARTVRADSKLALRAFDPLLMASRLESDQLQPFLSNPVLTDERADVVASDLNKSIKYRLCIFDTVPESLGPWQVCNGCAHFKSQAYSYTCTLTLSGAETEDYWILVSVSFGTSSSMLSPSAHKQILVTGNNIIQSIGWNYNSSPGNIGNPDLDSKSRTVQIDEEKLVISDAVTPKTMENCPLVALANFLNQLAQSYSFESLYSEAVELSRTTYFGHLTYSIDTNHTQIDLQYWRCLSNTTFVEATLDNSTQTNYQGHLTLKLECRPSSNRHEPEKLLSESFAKDPCELKHSSNEVQNFHISAQWHDCHTPHLMNYIVKEYLPASNKLSQLIIHATQQHSLQILNACLDELHKNTLYSCSHIISEDNPFLQIPMTCHMILHLKVDLLTGARHLSGANISNGYLKLLKEANRQLLSSSMTLTEVLTDFRATTHLFDTEFKVAAAGLRSRRGLNLKKSDYYRFGDDMRRLLLVELHDSEWWLALAIFDASVKFALLQTYDSASSGFMLLHAEWIGLDQPGSGSLRIENLTCQLVSSLHQTCAHRLTAISLSRKLDSLNVSHVINLRSKDLQEGSQDLAALISRPSFQIESSTLYQYGASILSSFSYINFGTAGSMQYIVSTRLQSSILNILRDNHFSLRSSEVTFDSKLGIIYLFSDILDKCFHNARKFWLSFGRLLNFVQALAKENLEILPGEGEMANEQAIIAKFRISPQVLVEVSTAEILVTSSSAWHTRTFSSLLNGIEDPTEIDITVFLLCVTDSLPTFHLMEAFVSTRSDNITSRILGVNAIELQILQSSALINVTLHPGSVVSVCCRYAAEHSLVSVEHKFAHLNVEIKPEQDIHSDFKVFRSRQMPSSQLDELLSEIYLSLDAAP